LIDIDSYHKLKPYVIRFLKITFICFSLCILCACHTQKDTAASRTMQNITAKYNYLYNAHLLLEDLEGSLTDGFFTDYQQILPVYLSVEAENGELIIVNQEALDRIIQKAQTVIAEKRYSKHIAEAYLILAKACFLKGNYFLAQEYFDYVARTYTKDPTFYLRGLDGTARSLMQLKRMEQAAPILDSLENKLQAAKKDTAAPLATLAQSKLLNHEYGAAIPYLEAAIKNSSKQHQKIRWTYILGQLYEGEKNYPRAVYYYNRVIRSNAAYELYFNASLSVARINTLVNDQQKDKLAALLALIIDDKNAGFRAHIFNEMGRVAEADADFYAAAKYFQQALQAPAENKHQQGLSYLHLADLHFKHFKNYQLAKVYNDSAITILPKNYPAFTGILKKTSNMSYLSERFALIAFYDQTYTSDRKLATVNYIADNTRNGLPQNPDAKVRVAAVPYSTPGVSEVSKDQVAEAYFEIAGFYQQELKDQQEAAKLYQLILDRFPESTYAKILRDPLWAYNRSVKEAELTGKYNAVFDAYKKKKYQVVIREVNQLSVAQGSNTFAAQFAYLQALAIGRTFPVDSLLAAFKLKKNVFDQDSLISPLVKQHIAYIQQHLQEFKKRSVALVDNDPFEPSFIEKPLQEIILKQAIIETPAKALPLVSATAGNIFNSGPSASYYFVIAVNNASVTLSSSRFGIGQFNRGNYSEGSLKHRLIEFDNEQLIYVGNFSNFEDVKIYADGISPQLKQIMKVPANSYNSFVISKENFEKIINKDLLNKYLEFYKNNF
jgi:tetratricopeptide (TPR) repeat protein